MKNIVAKVVLAIWEIFLYENNRNYNFYRFSYKFALILFLFFLTNQKQESGFCFLFIASHAMLQNHSEFNRLLKRNFFTCYSCSYYSLMHSSLAGIIQKKSASGSRTLPLVIFDQSVPFSQSSIILRHIWVKSALFEDSGRCSEGLLTLIFSISSTFWFGRKLLMKIVKTKE